MGLQWWTYATNNGAEVSDAEAELAVADPGFGEGGSLLPFPWIRYCYLRQEFHNCVTAS